MDEEERIASYILILLRNWGLIVASLVACTVLGLVIAFGVGEPTFVAQALVATSKTATEISFDTAIKTTDDGTLMPERSRSRRLESFVALVPSPAVAQAVRQRLGVHLFGPVQSAEELAGMVEGSLLADTDLIAISVKTGQRDRSLTIADMWAQEYVAYINQLYGSMGDAPYEVIQKELAIAKETHDREQAALEAFLTQDRRGELERLASILSSSVEAGAEARGEAMATLLDEARSVERLLQAAADMRDQIEDGGEAAATSNALALHLLKVAAFSAYGWGNEQVVLEWGPVGDAQDAGPQDPVRDLESLMSVLEVRHEALRAELAAFASGSLQSTASQGAAQASGSVGTGPQLAQSMRELEEQLRGVQTQVEREKALSAQLFRRRDLARETYTTLLRKEAELALAAEIQGAEVRLTGPAVASRESKLATVAYAAAVGLAMGVLGAFGIEYWRRYRVQVA